MFHDCKTLNPKSRTPETNIRHEKLAAASSFNTMDRQRRRSGATKILVIRVFRGMLGLLFVLSLYVNVAIVITITARALERGS